MVAPRNQSLQRRRPSEIRIAIETQLLPGKNLTRIMLLSGPGLTIFVGSKDYKHLTGTQAPHNH